ncbi:hypothetical protein PSHT_01407 [Puccinia striiformis]|uniref:Uncharacterized protein n=1 Tax=Puccinia striiformis TaxID=27350 RepID=A0A2S4WKL8_9BASI|nr:hypothetical protein PSHT_01407 [Puccinia striiformis]
MSKNCSDGPVRGLVGPARLVWQCIFHIQPPPQEIFQDQQECTQSIQQSALNHGHLSDRLASGHVTEFNIRFT